MQHRTVLYLIGLPYATLCWLLYLIGLLYETWYCYYNLLSCFMQHSTDTDILFCIGLPYPAWYWCCTLLCYLVQHGSDTTCIPGWVFINNIILSASPKFTIPNTVTVAGTISSSNHNEQVLDKLQVERERGITVKAQTASLLYQCEGEEYLLNLIDTPVRSYSLHTGSVCGETSHE